jgi:hypothetical protein
MQERKANLAKYVRKEEKPGKYSLRSMQQTVWKRSKVFNEKKENMTK